MIPTSLLDDELWAAADAGVPVAPTILLVDEDPEVEVDEVVVLSGSSALG